MTEQKLPNNLSEEPSSLKLVTSLAIAGLISGVILVVTFVVTNPLILANKELAIRNAIYKVLPDCKKYETLVLSGDRLVEKIPEEGREQDKDERLIYAGFNERDEFVGFAVPGSEPGFQDLILAMYGYDGNAELIIGFEVLESKETPGLGDKIFKDADFQSNFRNLSIEPEIAMVKKGEKKKENQVEAITGATISSRAVVKLLNNSVGFWEKPIEEYLTRHQLKNALGSK